MEIDQKMAELKARNVNAKFGPQSLPPRTYMRGHDSGNWVRKHKFNEIRRNKAGQEDDRERKNIEFAKDLFISWDDDGSGSLEAEEIIKPLITLGLAPNSDFATRLLRAIDPSNPKRKRGDQQKKLTDLKICLTDFIKIFRSSKVSDSLLGLIEKET